MRTILVHYRNLQIMLVISSREFRDNQARYFDLVDKDEQVLIQRGKDKAYILNPVTEIDRMSVNPELIAKVKRAEESIRAGKGVRVKNKEELQKLFDSL